MGALTDPTFEPALRNISTITNDNPASVTTTFDHDYVSGTIVRFFIPPQFGMQQIDSLSGEITVTGTDTFTVDINTLKFDTFSVPTDFPYDKQVAQVIPIGENSSQLTAATRNVLND